MNKFLNWMTKDKNVLFIILTILIIPLYILRFGDSISDKVVREITIVGVIFSTTFLYLTFKLNRDNYKRELGKNKVDAYLEKIQKLKSKWHYRDIFNEDVIPSAITPTDSTSNYFNYLDANLGFAVNLIFQNIHYKEYLPRIQGKDDSLINCTDEIFLDLNNRINAIHKVLELSHDISRDFVQLYHQLVLDKDYMSDAQVKLVLKEFDDYLKGYSSLCKAIKSNSFYGEDLFFIADIRNDNYPNGIRRTFLPILPFGILSNYENIQALLREF